MMRRAFLVALLGAVAVLVAVSPARADNVFYLVTGVGDVGGSCSPYPNVQGAFTCTTLRAAVSAANADAAEDDIYLQDGQTYSVNQAIPLTTDVAIFSGNARTTTLQSGSVDRLFTVAPGVTVTLYGVTLKGGNAGAGDGGAIDNAGSLELIEARVTGNRATDGGGIANEPTGRLSVEFSLIDNNQASVDGGVGGGIVNHGTFDEVVDSTIALNTAGQVGGISSDGDTFTTLTHATIAGNQSPGSDPAGVSFLTGDWTSTGSLFTANQGDSQRANCNTPQSGGTGNLADDASCGFGTAGDSQLGLPTTIQLLSDGGMTDVVDVTGTRAKGFETTCSTPYDQRLGQRQINAPCDAGAYEQGVPAGPITPLFAFPTPTPSAPPPPPPTPTATPTVTPTPTPTPVPGQTVVAKPVKGTIKIKLPGTNTFVDLDTTQGIPVGATVDTRHGTVQLTALQTPGGKTETATFFDGLFKLTQTKATTDLTLNESLAPCPRHGRAASVAAKKPKTRQLWGSGHGSFRTRGQYSAATVRGTKWLVQDSCAGTLTRVAQGVVSVRDNVRRKTIILRAGKKYLARPRH